MWHAARCPMCTYYVPHPIITIYFFKISCYWLMSRSCAPERHALRPAPARAAPAHCSHCSTQHAV
eukprot:scaffold1182_cov124-Isochrysis_galbana.AAC.2